MLNRRTFGVWLGTKDLVVFSLERADWIICKNMVWFRSEILGLHYPLLLVIYPCRDYSLPRVQVLTSSVPLDQYDSLTSIRNYVPGIRQWGLAANLGVASVLWWSSELNRHENLCPMKSFTLSFVTPYSESWPRASKSSCIFPRPRARKSRCIEMACSTSSDVDKWGMPGFSWGFAARACHSLGIIGVPDDEEVLEHSTCLSGYAYSVAQAAQISSDSPSLDHQSCANDSPPVTFVPSRRNIRHDGDAQVTRVPQWVSLVSRLSSEDRFHGKSWRAIWTNTNAVWSHSDFDHSVFLDRQHFKPTCAPSPI